jgi:late competence protein required for DNA uptake (superfamily II DNA/RNA helicase)
MLCILIICVIIIVIKKNNTNSNLTLYDPKAFYITKFIDKKGELSILTAHGLNKQVLVIEKKKSSLIRYGYVAR